MVNNSKNAFWQALILSIIIFSIGLILGFFLEKSRTSSIEINSLNSEINLLDEQLRNKVIENLQVDCIPASDSAFKFADRIYAEALKLEQYDSSAKFISTLKVIHKRYDLLRLMLWLESTKLKKNCSSEFHTIVYFFDYDSQDIKVRAEQTAFSRLLTDLKERYPHDILLIPIAGNLNIEAIDLAKDKYDIISSPSILIDEKEVVDKIITLQELENHIFNSNKA